MLMRFSARSVLDEVGKAPQRRRRRKIPNIGDKLPKPYPGLTGEKVYITKMNLNTTTTWIKNTIMAFIPTKVSTHPTIVWSIPTVVKLEATKVHEHGCGAFHS